MARSSRKRTANKASSNAGATIEVIFAGPLLLVPSTDKGRITGLDVFVP
jgi:hypothetical protein